MDLGKVNGKTSRRHLGKKRDHVLWVSPNPLPIGQQKKIMLTFLASGTKELLVNDMIISSIF